MVNSPGTRKVALRYLLSRAIPHRTKVAFNMNAPTPTIWYENEAGDEWVPPEMIVPPPEGFVFMHSMFPAQLVESISRLVRQEDIDVCSHSDIVVDTGLIDGLEGRICRVCGGSQTKPIGEPWPSQWNGGGGSKHVMEMTSSYNSDLVLALTRPTPEEMQKALKRGHRIQPVSFERAILLAANSCERCLNVLLYRCGLDDGYEEGSDEWVRCGTSCDFCK